MGFFDEVFKSDAQLDNEYRIHTERRIQAAQQQQMYAAGAASQLGAQYNTALGMGTQKPVRPQPRFDPNTSEAFQIPLSQAVTMWQVKFGDKWYDAHKPRPESGIDFYTDVFDRLRKERLFEDIDGWYRLKENVENLLANH